MEARTRGLIDVVDRAFLKACEEPKPARRTVIPAAMAAASPAVAMKRA
jgi:hypothetical protein